jgi:phosphatidylserine/phosphatidylglycerophosphate/cardiolipin synthase-like enzyme
MKKLTWILGSLVAFSAQAMESPKKALAASSASAAAAAAAAVTFQSPVKTTPFFTSAETDGGFKIVLQSLEKTGPGDTIVVDQFIMTDVRLTNLLIKKHRQGVKISVNGCGSSRLSQRQIARLKQAGIDVFVFNSEGIKIPNPHNHFPVKYHKKSIAWTYIDPKTDEKEYRVWSGGRNLSYMSAGQENKETNEEAMIYHRDDKETFESQVQAHERARKRKPEDTLSGTQVLSHTPKKPRTLQSDQHDICASIAERIRHTEAGDTLMLSIFAINHPDILHTCLESAQKGALRLLITDRYSFRTQESVDFLKKLAQLGVNVRVFNPTGEQRCGRFPVINHEKMFIRKKADGSTLTGIGSTNFTASNNRDISDWSFNPDKEFALRCIEHMSELEKKSVPLAEYTALQ